MINRKGPSVWHCLIGVRRNYFRDTIWSVPKNTIVTFFIFFYFYFFWGGAFFGAFLRRVKTNYLSDLKVTITISVNRTVYRYFTDTISSELCEKLYRIRGSCVRLGTELWIRSSVNTELLNTKLCVSLNRLTFCVHLGSVYTIDDRPLKLSSRRLWSVHTVCCSTDWYTLCRYT
jgi:hypothetical protein